ncbi:MAG: hypothetical protein H2056_03945 [Sphingopyxis sp.]|nr:hypothetical protein [Sphingopyxis sp.]
MILFLKVARKLLCGLLVAWAANGSTAYAASNLDGTVFADLGLNCRVVDPKGAQGTVLIAIDERQNSSVRFEISTFGLNNFVPNEVAAISTFQDERSPIVRQFEAVTPLGPLVLRLLNRDMSWGVELAPAEWTILSGPLATGRCSVVSSLPGDLIPLLSHSSLKAGQATGMGGVNSVDQWQWGNLQKQCAVVSDTSEARTKLNVNELSKLSYIDTDGTVFETNIDSILISRDFGHDTMYSVLKISKGKDELSLTFFFRQGRFWIDGRRRTGNTTPTWFKGVCVEALDV